MLETADVLREGLSSANFPVIQYAELTIGTPTVSWVVRKGLWLVKGNLHIEVHIKGSSVWEARKPSSLVQGRITFRVWVFCLSRVSGPFG